MPEIEKAGPPADGTASQPDEAGSRVGDRRPGGRAERVRASVLAATSELLGEVGYERLTVDEVASRAGVHKTTVYRRWPTKAELVAASVRLRSAENIPVPDTGSLNGDLQRFIAAVIGNVSGDQTRSATRSLVAAASSSDELLATMHSFWADRLAVAIPMVERAIERGELPADTDAKLFIEAAIGPIWVRLLLTGNPITPALADQITSLLTE